MNDEDGDLALFLAFRYALGRKTYVVEEVKNLLIKYKDVLHPDTRIQIKYEIEYAIANKKAGMKCDVDCWKRVEQEL